MDETLKIVAIIALISTTIFVILGMLFLSKSLNMLNDITKNFDKISDNFSVLKTRMLITLDEVSEMKEDLKSFKNKSEETLMSVKHSSDKANHIIDKYNEKTDRIFNAIEPYERLINDSYKKIAPPVYKVTDYLGAITKAVSVFADKLSKK